MIDPVPKVVSDLSDRTFAPMTAATRADAEALLGNFLGGDEHYLASRANYGDGGTDALARALELFLARPEIGFVWLAFAAAGDSSQNSTKAIGACVVCLCDIDLTRRSCRQAR
jgi:hypothetical protein